MPLAADSLFVGIDVGTSGVRACAIDAAGEARGLVSVSMPPPTVRAGRAAQSPAVWWTAVETALDELVAICDPRRVRALAVDGTSGTVLLADPAGAPLGDALMYHDQSSLAEAERIRAVAPGDSAAHGASSGLAKVLQLLRTVDDPAVVRALAQADWIAGRLRGAQGIGDENNALKTGYDPVRRAWPEWLSALAVPVSLLATIVPAGTPTGAIAPAIARRFGFDPTAVVVAGTTDSVAAALAAGIEEVGDAVTSLGSTLVLKTLAERPVTNAALGVYTHRVGDRWLAGGASNTGGAVLASLFTPETIAALSARIDPEVASPLDYYPLLRPGERFPVNDPLLPPRLVPRPDDDVAFLHGVLESMARIERDGYRVLARLGAPYPRRVLTAGGGAGNATWRRIRGRVLGVPVRAARHADAAYGAARLAREGAR